MSLAVWYGLVGLIVLLAVAAVIAGVVRRCFRTEELARVCLRIKTWFYIIAVFAGLFFLPVSGVFIALASLILWALWEICTTTKASSIRMNGVFAAGLSCLVIVSLFCAFLLYERSKDVFFFVVVLTQLNDIFQYLWGKSFGRYPVLPKISPFKTWEGLWGGIISSAFVAYWAGSYFWNWNAWESFGAGGLIAACGFMGDATVSAFKRRLKIKDLGNSLPGHGGLLDRLDSLLYVFPLAVWII